jgi:acyl carrier protein
MATQSEIKDKVVDIIAKSFKLEPSQVTEEKSFQEDLGADSLEIVELVMALEEEFGVEISDEDAERIKTVGDALRFIAEHPANPAGGH